MVAELQTRIPFSDIPDSGSRYEIAGTAWLPDDLRSGAAGPALAELVLLRKQANRIEVRGALETTVTLQCDRCLQDFGFTVAARFGYLLEAPGPGHHWRIHDFECDRSDLDIIQLLEPVVDLEDILRQQVLLGLPEKKLCTARCRGLCPTCGTDLNEHRCSCTGEEKQSPFAVLASVRCRTVKK